VQAKKSQLSPLLVTAHLLVTWRFSAFCGGEIEEACLPRWLAPRLECARTGILSRPALRSRWVTSSVKSDALWTSSVGTCVRNLLSFLPAAVAAATALTECSACSLTKLIVFSGTASVVFLNPIPRATLRSRFTA